MNDVQRRLMLDAIEKTRRYGQLCREEAERRGRVWTGYDGLLATAQEYEVRAEVMQMELDEQFPQGKAT